MWLYVPQTSSPCAQESEDSSSVSVWRYRPLARSASWRGKLQPPRAWSRRWKQGGFIRLLSGLTCSPSTLDLGVASFISSLRETPAKTTASPESAPVPMESGFSLPRSAGSLPSAGLILSSERTSRGTRTDSSRPSSRHWSDWATALRQEYSVRPRPEIPCGASDCSSWPSARVERGGYTRDHGNPEQQRPTLEGLASEWIAPAADDTSTRSKKYAQGGTALSMQADQWAAPQARDHFPAHSPEYVEAKKAEGHGMRNLNDEAATWQSPATDSFRSRGGDRKEEMGLDQQARTFEAEQDRAWPGPQSRDYRSGESRKSDEELWGTKGLPLERVATQHFHPPSSPGQPIAGGAMSSTDSPNSNQPSARRKLNPIFVEALMRWPTGLSGFERPAMALTLWWQLQHSYLSALVSASSEAPKQGSLF